MPYIRVSATKTLTEDERTQIVDGLGAAIEVVPGKNRSGLIVDIEDGRTIYVGGAKQENLVFTNVKYFSNYEYHIKKNLTAAIFDVFTKVLGTPQDKSSVIINEHNNWGNFGNYKDEYYSE